MFKCVLIDDENSATEHLSQLLSKNQHLTVLKVYNDATLAYNELILLDQPIDFLFVDIVMPKINGLELSKLLNTKYRNLIFVTAYSNYAFEAFEVSADGYLMKPFGPNQLDMVLKKILNRYIK